MRGSSKPPKAGHVFVDIVAGVEGDCLTIGDDCSSFRVAGPKPWGGGRTKQRFSVAIEDLRRIVEQQEQANTALLKASPDKGAGE